MVYVRRSPSSCGLLAFSFWLVAGSRALLLAELDFAVEVFFFAMIDFARISDQSANMLPLVWRDTLVREKSAAKTTPRVSHETARLLHAGAAVLPALSPELPHCSQAMHPPSPPKASGFQTRCQNFATPPALQRLSRVPAPVPSASRSPASP